MWTRSHLEILNVASSAQINRWFPAKHTARAAWLGRLTFKKEWIVI